MIILTFAAMMIISVSVSDAQNDLDGNLHKQTMFDWYIASPEARLATAVNIIAEVFIPEGQEEFDKFRLASKALVACINGQLQDADSRMVAPVANFCLKLIRTHGFL